MSTWNSVRAALKLLPDRDRRLLALVAALQSSLALMDLVGIALIGVVAGLSTSLVDGSAPAYLQGLVATLGLTNSDLTGLVLALAATAAVILMAKSFLSFFIARRMFSFLAKRQAQVCGDLARRLLSRPLLEVQGRSSQETAYAMTAGMNAAFLGILGSAVVLVSEAALLVVLGLGLAVVDLVVCLFTIIFFLVIGLVVHRVLSNWAGRLGVLVGRTEIASIVSVQEAIRSYRELTVSGRRDHYANEFQILRNTAAEAQAGTQIVNLIPKYVFEVMMVVGGGLLVASQILTRDAAAAIAIVAVYLAAASRIMPSMLRLQSSLITIKNSSGIAEATYSLIADLDAAPDLHSVTPPASPAAAYEAFDSTLHLTGVGFTFPGLARPVLEDITLTVGTGTSLAIVGPTGAGKSTLVDIAMGLIDPDYGHVLVSGVGPAEAIQRWPGSISCVPQSISVIEGTIRANVALGMPASDISDVQVWEALAQAQLSSFLEEQRDGLDAIVGENGVKLSGGQRQRLGLARALYSKPQLIFLDEATSALDAETERAISETLMGLSGRVTLVVIAHRLATVRHADQVAYLEAGRLKFVGTFDAVRVEVPDFDRQARLLGM